MQTILFLSFLSKRYMYWDSEVIFSQVLWVADQEINMAKSLIILKPECLRWARKRDCSPKHHDFSSFNQFSPSVDIYTMSCIPFPKYICDVIDSRCINCFWGNFGTSNKIHPEILFLPKEYKGLGIHSASLVNKSLVSNQKKFGKIFPPLKTLL